LIIENNDLKIQRLSSSNTDKYLYLLQLLYIIF